MISLYLTKNSCVYMWQFSLFLNRMYHFQFTSSLEYLYKYKLSLKKMLKRIRNNIGSKNKNSQ
jgi:hypothetical protein